ncbi:tRNA1(Val) (adenine(37)-N6)-methyltransferase [Alteromonas sp. P256]|uniref:tRNA1(Val) (adenine(37)-N6)-methyltransferase n=1 Tax=Alteromonas sp. P256 TaxID=3117399 RepID=UPI002FDF43DF
MAQDKCAMRVNTDSLILGSWVNPNGAKSVLDIGTGTGILALMMAQKTDTVADIQAIEVDENAAQQAVNNVEMSKWSKRISVHHQALEVYKPKTSFDIIVSNPPYFEHSNKPTNAFASQTNARHSARQTGLLSPTALFQFAANNVSAAGSLYCVYPYRRMVEIEQAALAFNLVVTGCLVVKHDSKSDPYLCVYRFQARRAYDGDSERVAKPEDTYPSLTIRDNNGEYSSAFKALCRPFYLKF